MNITDYQDNSFLFFHSNSLNKKLELLNLAKY